VTAATLVLLHPLPLDGSIWAREISSLTPRSIAPTLYAYGDTLDAWAVSVIEEAGDGPLVVVGNSVGGSCALDVVRLDPGRVQLLVLVGTKAAHRPEPRVRDEALELLARDGIAAAWDRYWAPLFAADADPTVVAAARSVALRQTVDDLAVGVRAFHGRPDRSDLARSIDVPTLVVCGEHDPLSATAPAFAGGLRRGRCRIVEGAGHYVPVERPAELAALIAAELDSVAW